MDSKLDGVFRTTFRTTEQTDSWLGIRHDEDRGQGRKKDDRKEESDEFSFDDDAHVSVSALYIFLRDLLIQAGTAVPTPQQPQTTTPAAPPPEAPPPTPVAQQASMAAHAYQNTARQGSHSISISDTAPPPPPTATGPKVELSPDEVRTIQRLMNDLETLAGRGIATLTIKKADTFLQSLRAAVDLVLAG
jgi:hypothetical protein